MVPGPGSQSSSESDSEASGSGGNCVATSLVAAPGVLAASDMAAIDGQPLKYVSGCFLLVIGCALGLLKIGKAARLLAACKVLASMPAAAGACSSAGAAILPINDIVSG